MKKTFKSVLSIVLCMMMLVSTLAVGGTLSASATSYSHNNAVDYASRHWNDGVGACAQFVSACVTAGGISVSDTVCYNLYNSLKSYGTVNKLTTYGSGTNTRIRMSDNTGKVSAGDPLFYVCETCGGVAKCCFPHVVLCGGVNTSGFLTAYGHNAAWDNEMMYTVFTSGTHSGHSTSIYCIHLNESTSSSSSTALPGSFDVSLSSKLCSLASTVTLSWTVSSNKTNYWIDGWNETTNTRVIGAIDNSRSREITFDEAGHYIFLVRALNANGETRANQGWVSVDVYDDVPGEFDVSVSKSSVFVDKSVTLSWTKADNAVNYWIDGWNETTSTRVIGAIDTSRNREITFDEPGHYIFLVRALNAYGETRPNQGWVSVDVGASDAVPGEFDASVNRNFVPVGGTVTLTWTESAYRTNYWIDGWNETTSTRVIGAIDNSRSREITFDEAGHYIFLVRALNANGETRANQGWVSVDVGDTEAPEVEYSVTNNMQAWQTLDINISDNVCANALYFGTDENYLNNSYTFLSDTVPENLGESATEYEFENVIFNPGTYYITVVDYYGNKYSSPAITLYKTALDTNGGSTSPESVMTYSGNAFSVPSATKSGYTLKGWNTKADGTGISYAVGDSYTPASDGTLYAVWEADCTVSYDANGGTGAPSKQDKIPETELILSSDIPALDGYTFNGWNTKSDGSGTSYVPGGVYTNDETVTLYAQWTKNHVHEYVTVTKEATCTEGGYVKRICSCGDEITDSVTDPLGHSEVTDPAVPAKCEEIGLTEGSHCSRCNEVLKAQESISPIGHDYSAEYKWSDDGSMCIATAVCKNDSSHKIIEIATVTGKVTNPATCLTNGTTEYTATFSNSVFSEQKKSLDNIAATGHKEVTDAAIAPTCTEYGLTEGSHCSVCYATITEQKLVPYTGHTLVKTNEVNPTCTSAGFTGTTYCSVCNELIDAGSMIPATGHTPTEAVKENEKSTSCSAEGSFDMVVYCSVCKAEISRTTVSVPKTAHVDANKDGYCDACGTLTDSSAANPCKNASLNASGGSVDYKTKVTLKATATGVPTGYYVAIYDGNSQVARGDNSSVTYNIGSMTSGKTYTVKIVDANGNVQKDASGNALQKEVNISVNSSFIKKLVAFFKGLFGSLPSKTIGA